MAGESSVTVPEVGWQAAAVVPTPDFGGKGWGMSQPEVRRQELVRTQSHSRGALASRMLAVEVAELVYPDLRAACCSCSLVPSQSESCPEKQLVVGKRAWRGKK